MADNKIMDEPKEPVELSLLSIYRSDSTHKNTKIVEHISEHICKCSALTSDKAILDKPHNCDSKLCSYFRWFYPYHYNQCSNGLLENPKQESGCPSCAKLKIWVQLHSRDCTINCPISLCQNYFKKDQLSKRLTNPHIRNLRSPHQSTNSPTNSQPAPTSYSTQHHPAYQGVTPYNPPGVVNSGTISNGRMSYGQEGFPRHGSADNVNDNDFREQSSQFMTNRSDSNASSISIGALWRGNRSDDPLLYQPAEHEPLEKENIPFYKTQSIQRYSVDNSRGSISQKVLEQHFMNLKSRDDNEPIDQSSIHPNSIPESDSQQSTNTQQPRFPVQRQNTLHNSVKKAVFSGSNRSSISLKLTTQYEDSVSVDSHTPEPELKEEVRKSPRRSRVLSAKRKQQLQSQKNISSDSPETTKRSTSLHPSDSIITVNQYYRTETPDLDPSEDFASLDDNEQVFSDSETHKTQIFQTGSNREVYSPSSDSSPGPSSLEEVQGPNPRSRVLQRVDTDPGQKHSKIILGGGSLTPADAQKILGYGLGSLALLRPKKTSNADSTDYRSSGVSSASISGSSIHSARSSGVSDDSDFSSMQHPEGDFGSYGNYETEDSASTIVGNSDHSLSSDYYQTHSCNSYSRQPSDVTVPYHQDSGRWDDPASENLSDAQYTYSSGLPCSARLHPSESHPHSLPPTQAHPHRHTSPLHYPSHSWEPSPQSAEEPPVICPYAIAHSSDESDSEDTHTEEPIEPLSPSFFKNSLREVDRVLEQHQQDLHVMRNRPKRGGKVPTHKHRGMSEEDKQQLQVSLHDYPMTYPLDHDTDYFPMPANFRKVDPEVVKKERALYEEAMSQRLPDTPEEEEKIWNTILARRDQLKQYLVGQFYSGQVYREISDWERKSKLGSGAQAACFSVCDLKTKCMLVLKEETENRKTLDEAYVSLKLACQSNPSPNIVEYYTAALLPGHLTLPPRPSPYVQIFMEQMPTCLQGWLFKCGPIPQHNVHHYACQLFDALDFLHNKQGIIHCDIKPLNILVDDTAQRIKLTDFGCAEILEKRKTDFSEAFSADPNAGTLSYNPPEFYRDQTCSFAFDIWQAGCCVLAMCTGRRPWRHLFMDVYPSNQPNHLITMVKKGNRDKIKQQRHGHPHPAFLEPTLKKLLHGCLHDDPSKRLSAKECSYLINTESASTEEERRKIIQALGYTPGRPAVLQSFSTEDRRVDVYLGSDRITDVPLIDHTPSAHQGGGGVRLALYKGWVGSIDCPEGMTYRQAEAEIHRQFPVTNQLGSFILATYDNSPHSVWAVSSVRGSVPPYRPVRPDSPVDPDSAIILSPTTLV